MPGKGPTFYRLSDFFLSQFEFAGPVQTVMEFNSIKFSISPFSKTFQGNSVHRIIIHLAVRFQISLAEEYPVIQSLKSMSQGILVRIFQSITFRECLCQICFSTIRFSIYPHNFRCQFHHGTRLLAFKRSLEIHDSISVSQCLHSQSVEQEAWREMRRSSGIMSHSAARRNGQGTREDRNSIASYLH
jgi:hypothetical protein